MSSHNLNHNRRKTNHVIERIDYSENYILCICGWDGKPDQLKQHQKDSPPLPDIAYENAWKKMYAAKDRVRTMPTTAVMREVDFLGDLK